MPHTTERLPRRCSWQLLIGAVLAASACGAQPVRPPAKAKIADKQALFGDPGLVPTREGEHVRRELADAGEIARALRTFPYIDDVRVDVERPRRDTGRVHVLVAARLAAGTVDRDTPRQSIAQVVTAVVGDVDEDDLVIVLSAAEEPAAPPPMAFPLLLAAGLLGLGLSTGVTLERARARLKRPRR